MNKKQITLYLEKETARHFRIILLNDDRFATMADWIRKHVEAYIESNQELLNK